MILWLVQSGGEVLLLFGHRLHLLVALLAGAPYEAYQAVSTLAMGMVLRCLALKTDCTYIASLQFDHVTVSVAFLFIHNSSLSGLSLTCPTKC